MSDRGYYRYPTINGDTVIFCCEDDLWVTATGGGLARRLTAGRGECSLPRLSPDGRLLAYVGREEGHPEVYVMPAEGGAARRLTYLGADYCFVSGWTPDGREILFVSDAGSPFIRQTEAYAVSPDGGEPRPLKLGHVQNLSISDRGDTAIGSLSMDPAMWKRYRGGKAGDIWINGPDNDVFSPLLALPGNMVWPMWLGARVYFLSDHDGVGNIYSCLPDGSDLKQHTFEDEYFARYPSTDGKRIVYTAGARIKVYDPGADRITTVEVEAPSTPTRSARKFVPAADYLEHFSPHPDGHALAIIARGQPFTLPFWEEAPLQHGVGSSVRYRHCEWLADGKRFVVVNDHGGQERIELHHKDQSTPPEVISQQDMGRILELSVSPVSDMVAIANHRYELLLVDLASRDIKTVDRSPAKWVSDVTWSPDGRWVAYCWSPHHDTTIIRIAEAATGTTRDATTPLRVDSSPSFDPEGKYLYFISTRNFKPVYDSIQFDLSFPQAARPFLVTLRKEIPDPFVAKPKPIVQKEKGEAQRQPTQEPSEKTDQPSKPDKQAPVEIDFDGITRRILAFPVEEGRYDQIVGAKGRALFTKFPVRGIGREEIWFEERHETGTLMAYDFDEQRAAPLWDEVGRVKIAGDHRTLAYRSKNRLRVIDALDRLPLEGEKKSAPEQVGRKSGWIDIDRVQVLTSPPDEWAQMYEEAWRLQTQQFWDEQMSQVDWRLVHDRYAALVPLVRTRSELSDLIWEMQGELGTSHAYEFGGDYLWPPQYRRGFLGADVAFDPTAGGYRIATILRGDSWDPECDSPLAEPGLNIQEGDLIVAVGGRRVGRDYSVHEALLNSAGKEVMLTILSPTGDRRQVSVRTLKDERWLRYRAWVEHNRLLVHEKTGGRIGYVHIPDMGPFGFAEFHRSYLIECHRDGLIVDARYNRGGHVSPLLLEKLLRKRVGYDVSRWSVPLPHPIESVAGPIVGLTNQFAGSDGDIFSHCFKLYKIGPLVGKRTWGGVIGICPRHRLVDGTLTTQPEYSFWFVDVGWKVENYGTEPDYDVDIAPHDYKADRDPQMDKAIELALDALEKNPVRLPAFGERPSLAIPRPKKPVTA